MPFAPNFAAGALGTWQFSITNQDQAAVPGATVVYSGIIENNTGEDIFLIGSDLQFSMSAPLESFEFDLAPEFSAIAGVIPPAGYAGPLCVVTWLSAPPVGSSGGGTLELIPEAASGLPVVSATFTSAFKPQQLVISQAGGQITLSWSLEAADMVLQSTLDLEEPEWADVNAAVTEVDGRNIATIPIEPVPQFYRLVRFY
jgi:hypothetical protein